MMTGQLELMNYDIIAVPRGYVYEVRAYCHVPTARAVGIYLLPGRLVLVLVKHWVIDADSVYRIWCRGKAGHA